ncbi:translation initiation factor eIF-2B epsilon subunit, GEF [Coemansia sp. RSA 552]|nr:translation initiation factor eIF-2B epsilon subunit, GEF [Coemansia sp. RSA 552]
MNKGEEKDELKAVVLADAFDAQFAPLGQRRAFSVAPLCNVPMIEYTLEFLELSGVAEAIIVCAGQADSVREYLKQSRWSKHATGAQMRVVVRAAGGTTVGDALRAVDDSGAVTSDFVLCTGIVVANISVARLVATHVLTRRRDPSSIMTMALQETAQTHRRLPQSDECVYFIDPEHSRLVALNAHSAMPRARATVIPRAALSRLGEVEVRADLADTGISVCSPDVLALFTENFDYHALRRDFVHGILESDLLGKSVYTHVLAGADAVPGAAHGGYAAAVVDSAAYDAISRDMVARWTFPLCPDNAPIGAPYSYHRGAVYKAPGVRLDRACKADHHVVLGPASHVASHANVSDSVLGANCAVGEHAMVRGSYLFDDVQVGRGARIEASIVGARVTILDGVVIGRGCLIGDDVTLGPNIHVPPFTRIARDRPPRSSGMLSDSDDEEEEDSSEDEAMDANKSLSPRTSETQELFDAAAIGSGGAGYVWPDASALGASDSESDYGSDDEDADLALRLKRLQTIGASMEDYALSSDDDEMSGDSDAPAEELTKLSPQEEFERELYLTVKRADDERLAPEKSALELKSLRMSYNKDQDDMRAAIVHEIFRTIDVESLPDSTAQVLRRWSPVMAEYIGGGRDQLDVVGICERYCALEDDLATAVRPRLFVRLVYMLYQLDLVEDVAIIAWYNRALKKPEAEVNHALLRALEPVVDGLNESDGSDDDDDDDDEVSSEDSEGSEEDDSSE